MSVDMSRYVADFRSAQAQPVASRGSGLRHAHVVETLAADLPGLATYGPAQAILLSGNASLTIVLASGGSLVLPEMAGGMWHPLPPFTQVTVLSAGTAIAGY